MVVEVGMCRNKDILLSDQTWELPKNPFLTEGELVKHFLYMFYFLTSLFLKSVYQVSEG